MRLCRQSDNYPAFHIIVLNLEEMKSVDGAKRKIAYERERETDWVAVVTSPYWPGV